MSYTIEGVNGVKINVEEIGTGRPIVFLHGWPVNHQMFEYQFNELPMNGYRCIGIDLRGYGDSDKPWKGYNYDTMSDDVRAVMDALNLQGVTLLGFSMGGAIAIRYMARHKSAHVTRLVLLGAAAPRFTHHESFPYGIAIELVNELIKQTYNDRPAMLKTFSQNFFAHPERLSPEFALWHLSLGLAAASHATIQCAIELRDADLRSELPAVQVPTLVIHGEEDRICPFELAKILHDGIRGSLLIGIKGAGHGFYYEERDKVNEELIRFIA